MATHSSILAWRIPWTEEPSRLQSMGLQSRTRLCDSTFFLILEITIEKFATKEKSSEQVFKLIRVLCFMYLHWLLLKR